MWNYEGLGSRGEWRRLHNQEVYGLCSSPSTIRVIKYRRIRWPGHVARMGTGNVSERVQMGDLGIGGWVILKCIIKKWDGVAWTGLIWLGIETGGWRL